MSRWETILQLYLSIMPIGVDDIIKKSSINSYSKDALEKIHTDIEKFAEAEHLTAHANSIKVRFE